MSDRISVGPMGIGPRPSGAVSYVAHPPGTYVKWQLDSTGWAVGYSIAYIEKSLVPNLFPGGFHE